MDVTVRVGRLPEPGHRLVVRGGMTSLVRFVFTDSQGVPTGCWRVYAAWCRLGYPRVMLKRSVQGMRTEGLVPCQPQAETVSHHWLVCLE